MEQKINSLKSASKVISVIMKIGYIAMIVGMCVCLSSLLFMAITGGKTQIVIGSTTVGVKDASVSPSEVIAICAEYFIMGVFLFTIFLLAQKMFGEIGATGDPFTLKYVRYIRAIGILIAAMTVICGFANTIISSLASVKGLETYTEAPGIVFGAVIFCLSYVIDYGCGLKTQRLSEKQ